MANKPLQWHAQRFTPSPQKVEITCAECGRAMWLPPSKVGEYLRCGLTCNVAWKAKRRAARTRQCETCGKSFLARWTQLRRGGGRFCSQRCNEPAHTAGNLPENRQKAWATRRANAKGSPNP